MSFEPSFSKYFLNKKLNEKSNLNNDLILESKQNIKIDYVSFFSEKFPKAPQKDIEDAFKMAFKLAKGLDSEKEKSRNIKKNMKKILIEFSKNNKTIRKKLSCVKSIKKSNDDIIKKAEKILNSQEKKIIKMCAQGKSVRSMAKEMNISHPTAWRILNIAIDKIRIYHGIKSRGLGK